MNKALEAALDISEEDFFKNLQGNEAALLAGARDLKEADEIEASLRRGRLLFQRETGLFARRRQTGDFHR
jgi:hypothetical protein